MLGLCPNWIMSRRDLAKFIEESRARQRNIVFPDTVRNFRSVDTFLWRGSPNPTLVQRIGAWLFGVTEMGLGGGGGTLAFNAYEQDRDLADFGIMTLLALFCAAIGIRTFRNGFPRRVKRQGP
jgi:hypothetical protein